MGRRRGRAVREVWWWPRALDEERAVCRSCHGSTLPRLGFPLTRPLIVLTESEVSAETVDTGWQSTARRTTQNTVGIVNRGFKTSAVHCSWPLGYFLSQWDRDFYSQIMITLLTLEINIFIYKGLFFEKCCWNGLQRYFGWHEKINFFSLHPWLKKKPNSFADLRWYSPMLLSIFGTKCQVAISEEIRSTLQAGELAAGSVPTWHICTGIITCILQLRKPTHTITMWENQNLNSDLWDCKTPGSFHCVTAP